MNKNVTGVKLNFLKNIGDMSDKKIELFTEEFVGNFPMKQNVQGGLLLNKTLDNTISKSLLIFQNQVTYSMEGQNVQPDFYEAKNSAKKIFDKLYLDSKCTGVCVYTCIVELDENFSEVLKNKIDIRLKGMQDTQGIHGVGIKVFINSDDYRGAFSAEPFLQDSKYMFCNLEVQLNKAKVLNDIIKESEKVFNDIFDNLVTQTYYKVKDLGQK